MKCNMVETCPHLNAKSNYGLKHTCSLQYNHAELCRIYARTNNGVDTIPTDSASFSTGNGRRHNTKEENYQERLEEADRDARSIAKQDWSLQ